MDLGLRNSEGYYDFTAFEAIENITKEERKMKKLVFICSPFKDEMERNIVKAQGYCRFAVSRGFIPIAVHLLFPQFMDDLNENERDKAIKMGLEILSKCDEIWCFGQPPTEGMTLELKQAKKLGIKIKLFTRECREVEI